MNASVHFEQRAILSVIDNQPCMQAAMHMHATTFEKAVLPRPSQQAGFHTDAFMGIVSCLTLKGSMANTCCAQRATSCTMR